MIHFPRLFVRFGQFKVPVALCSVRSVVLLLMTCPRATTPCQTTTFYPALLLVLRCSTFSAARIFRQTVSMLRCALNNVPSFLVLHHAPFPPLQLSTKYNKLRLPCLGKIMFTLVLSAKSINAIDLKALPSFYCYFFY